MRFIKNAICIILSISVIICLFSGCSSKSVDDSIYIKKGDFFSYFVYENNMTSQKYSLDDIKKCNDGSVESEIIVEWGYLPEKLARKNLNKTVDRETVVAVCANATSDLKKGKTADIKDADMLYDAQLIADAYESGFFELENGYFNAAQKMTFGDCEKILNKAREYSANYHYEANTEITKTADGVKEQDASKYSEGDIIIDFSDGIISEGLDDSPKVTGTAFKYNSANNIKNMSLKTEAGKPTVLNMVSYNNNAEIKQLAYYDHFGFQDFEGFSGNILKQAFENALGNPNIGDTVVLNRYQVLSASALGNSSGQIMGILQEKRLVGDYYLCLFKYPNFEQAIQKKNIEQSNGSGIKKDGFDILKNNVEGWNLNFNVTGDSVSISAEKKFTVYETGRKQNWQNSKKTMNAKASLKISDFNVDINNLGSFATNSGTGFIKLTCDTEIGFSLDSSLRYTPDDNRNGKFPSNWNNSRWTDSDSQGAKTIKIAKFPVAIAGGMVKIEVYIYLQISVDGKITFTTSIDDGGVKITANNGNIGMTKLGTKKTEFSANVNLHNRLGLDVSVKIFWFINVIEYDVGADLDISATVNLYYEEKLKKKNVYADEDGLNEYMADDGNFNYCINAWIQLKLSGKLLDSGVKKLLDLLSIGNSLDFSMEIWTGGFHFEDGSFVDECTRGNNEEDIEETDDEIGLSTYKIIIPLYACSSVDLKSLPTDTVNMYQSRNSVQVKSNDESIVKATYNKSSHTIQLETFGEGSTEVVVSAKKGFWWFKESIEQKISVTVNGMIMTCLLP